MSELGNVEVDVTVYDGGTTTTSMVTQPSLGPSIPFATHLGLTLTATVIFGLVFIFVYLQLWMILYYGHKKRSYQTIFLFLCLIWSALRLTLFTFYYSDSSIAKANDLHPILYWLLYSFPVVLQFMTLVLLVSFFSQVSLIEYVKFELNFRYCYRVARY